MDWLVGSVLMMRQLVLVPLPLLLTAITILLWRYSLPINNGVNICIKMAKKLLVEMVSLFHISKLLTIILQLL